MAFLDADDIWVKTKLDKQIEFMQKRNLAFSFTGYEFANAEGVALGRRVAVPTTISYEDYLRNNIIWTSTVMVDLRKIDKKDLYMPTLRYGEDALTWLKLLKKHGSATGLNASLAYYRRTRGSISANKIKIIYRKLVLYLGIEGIPVAQRLSCYIAATFNAAVKRV